MGAASPFLYAAAQLLSAPLYEGYDWRLQLASELGTVGSASAAVFNTAMVLSGLAALASAVGFKLGLKPFAAHIAYPWLIAVSALSSGGASVWAGLHPLPSPFHNPGYWGIGSVAFPLLLSTALWSSPFASALRYYLAGTAIAIVAFLLVSSGLTSLELSAYGGTLQRIGALLVYSPMAVVAMTILRIGPSETRKSGKVRLE